MSSRSPEPNWPSTFWRPSGSETLSASASAFHIPSMQDSVQGLGGWPRDALGTCGGTHCRWRLEIGSLLVVTVPNKAFGFMGFNQPCGHLVIRK